MLTPPKDTPEMIRLIDFVFEAKYTVLPEMKKKTLEVLAYELFLMDFMKFAGESLKQNTSTFQWTIRMKSALYDSGSIVEAKTTEFKDALLKRIETFKMDLDDYKAEVNEFAEFGNVNDIAVYAEKSRNLDNKLSAALETIDDINNLEKYFRFTESAFPLRKIVNIFEIEKKHFE